MNILSKNQKKEIQDETIDEYFLEWIDIRGVLIEYLKSNLNIIDDYKIYFKYGDDKIQVFELYVYEDLDYFYNLDIVNDLNNRYEIFIKFVEYANVRVKNIIEFINKHEHIIIFNNFIYVEGKGYIEYYFDNGVENLYPYIDRYLKLNCDDYIPLGRNTKSAKN